MPKDSQPDTKEAREAKGKGDQGKQQDSRNAKKQSGGKNDV